MNPLPAQVPLVVGPNAALSDAQLKALAVAAYKQAWYNASTDLYHLFTNNIIPTKLGGVAQFTEMTTAEWAAYAALAAINVGVLGHDTDGNWEQNGASLASWTLAVAALIPTAVYGMFMTDTTGAVLNGWYSFPVPITLGIIGDQVVVLPSAKAFE